MFIMELLRNFQYRWTQNLDPRVADLPLIGSSYQMPLILLAYLYFVLGCGPRFMKNRPPYLLKTFIKLYNIIQIIGNVWLIYDLHDGGLFAKSLLCNPADYSYDYVPMRITRCIWYFLMLKILDLVETGIFVLRKKHNQVSGLHLYHHVSTSLVTWVTIRHFAVAQGAANVYVNCIIHIMMYTYYFLAAWGPDVQKAIAPMKPRITQAQMVQFVILLSYLSSNFWPGCQVVEHWVALVLMTNVAINFYLFYNFYQKTYKKTKKIQ